MTGTEPCADTEAAWLTDLAEAAVAAPCVTPIVTIPIVDRSASIATTRAD
jgi:hypothetical protein